MLLTLQHAFRSVVSVRGLVCIAVSNLLILIKIPIIPPVILNLGFNYFIKVSYLSACRQYRRHWCVSEATPSIPSCNCMLWCCSSPLFLRKLPFCFRESDNCFQNNLWMMALQAFKWKEKSAVQSFFVYCFCWLAESEVTVSSEGLI